MITKFPFQFKTENGNSATVYTQDNKEYTQDNKEYRFNVIRNDGTALNFSWHTEDESTTASGGEMNAVILDALIMFWKLDS